MKQVLLFSLLRIGLLPANNPFANVHNNLLPTNHSPVVDVNTSGLSISSQQPGNEKMMATVFRAQEFCRIELKDFEWEVDFNIVSATVYFSGTNFTHVEKLLLQVRV